MIVLTKTVRSFRRHTAIWAIIAMTVLSGCNGLTDTSLPAGTTLASDVANAKGALGAYFATITAFQTVMPGVVVASGLLTDEYRSLDVGPDANTIGATGDIIDERRMPEGSVGSDLYYGNLHVVRNQGATAVAALEKYASDQPAALRGHADALRGYAELFLADLYCSGVPLNTVDFEHDFTLRPGATSAEIYEHATLLFDSALTLSRDSARFLNLARIGKGRTLLARGQYDEAAAAVADVPSGFQYTISFDAQHSGYGQFNVYGNAFAGVIGDGEGGNGLPYLQSGDPRSAGVFVRNAGNDGNGAPVFAPKKYSSSNTVAIVVADWIEARLIVAEALVRQGNNNAWLDTLNALRSTVLDSVGGAALVPLNDPGTAALRLSLVLDERAYWLFLTGHRQGDLRRRVREDGVPQNLVYPTGIYFGGMGRYGSDVTLPIPTEAERNNPFFTGCRDRNA